MKKSELNNGAVVELRNGDRYLKVDNTLLCLAMKSGYMPLDKYSDDLKYIIDENYDIMRVNNDVINAFGYLNRALYKVKLNNWTWERPKEILDEKEKEYLSAVIKPFRNRVRYITKSSAPTGKKFICICIYNDIIPFPYLNNENMYKGMKADREYTLEELGL